MKIFVAGASGAIGRRLVPLLVTGGHHVTAAARTPDKLAGLTAQGSEAVRIDGLDREDVLRAVMAARPEVIVHQMTALASMRSLKRFDEEFALTNRLRTEGTRYLLAAARAAGARKFVVQSYAGWPNERRGGRVKSEDDPFDPSPPRSMRRSMAAIRALEDMAVSADGTIGIVLRYGSFYGPGTSISENGEVVELLRRRQFPLVGSGAGVWSFIHIDDAARATKAAIENGPPGVYNIVDDDPAEVREWLPELARAVGAKQPWRMLAWLGRFFIGEAGALMMTQLRGCSNARAKHALGWKPVYSSWRHGFHRGLAPQPPDNEGQ